MVSPLTLLLLLSSSLLLMLSRGVGAGAGAVGRVVEPIFVRSLKDGGKLGGGRQVVIDDDAAEFVIKGRERFSIAPFDPAVEMFASSPCSE